MSLPVITPYCMKRNALSTSETLSSSSVVTQNPLKPLRCMVTGFLCGIKQLRQCSLSLSTEQQNSGSTAATSRSSSLHSMCHFTAESSSMTMLYGTKLHNDETLCSPTSLSSLTFMSSTSKSLALPVVIQRDIPKWLDQVPDTKMHADSSMRVVTLTHKQHAPVPMCAQSVAIMHTWPPNAR